VTATTATVPGTPTGSVAVQCSKAPWCIKGDGHPADKSTYSPCTGARQLYPTTNHSKPLGSVFAESDDDTPMVVVEHPDDEHGVSAMLLDVAEAEELVAALQAVLATVKAVSA
jgi:hypothetical protein